jgi:hypothetical protein
MSINLGAGFETETAALAGMSVFDPGSLEIALLNTSGPTTVRFTVSKNVDTPALKRILEKYTA